MAEPLIAMATTCKGRLEHLGQTLPMNLASNANFEKLKFIVLDYGDRDGLSDYLRLYRRQIENGRLVVYRYEKDGPFHVSHSKNMAARCGILEGADILVTLDADNFTGPNFARFVANKFAEPGVVPGIFLCPDFPLIKSLPHGPLRPQRGYAGRLALWSQAFIKAGGYDEQFDCWHGEDVDMVARLRRMGYSMRHFDNQNLETIPHGSELRFKEYPHARQYENGHEWKVIESRTETIVNHGQFGIGDVYRNFDAKPITLGPIPTRIFGIGMHKTGTSSLHAAFKILGFDSFHWGEGEAPLIWYEMNALGRSTTLEQFYALSDLPIPLLYKELDRAYPGSKFILTIRNEEDWMRSVERLWDYRYNPTRKLWDIYPFTNHIHTELYGQKHFDIAVFLERYQRHNAEVMAYFKDRPSDLLVLDMDDTENGWFRLCNFLNAPVPSVPYPFQNRTTYRSKEFWMDTV